MQIDLGKIKISWKGAYAAATEYEKDDAVFFSGSSYIHVGAAATTGTAPTAGADNSTWQLMAAGMPTMTTQGQIVFQGSSGPDALTPGTAGYVLTTRGAGADPEWAVPSSRQGSTVTKLPDTGHMTGGYRSGGAVMSDGTLRAWGHGNALGQGNNVLDRSQPCPVAMPKTDANVAKWVRCHSDNLVLMDDGSVYAWGANTYGCLGLGDTLDRYVPEKVTALDGVNIVDVKIGFGANSTYTFAAFLADDGTLYTCGYNRYGQLGHGNTTSLSTPTALSKTDWSKIVVVGTQFGRMHGIDTSGGLWSWGYQSTGEIGNGGTTANETSPVQITLPAACVEVSGSYDDSPAASPLTGGHSLCRLSDGRVYAWGSNNYGQLGVGTTNNAGSPQHVSGLNTDTVQVIAAGGDTGYSIAVKSDGTIRTFGYNNYGQLGNGNTNNQTSPVQPAAITGNEGIRKVMGCGSSSAGYGWTVVLFENGVVMSCGYNGNGQLGIGNNVAQNEFKTIPFMKGKITDVCLVGQDSETGLGLLNDAGLYFQTGYAGESQLPEPGDQASFVPFLVHM